MTVLREAIQTYHDELTAELAADSQAQLDDQLRRRGLFFGARPLCTVLRPRFLTPEQYQAIQHVSHLLLKAFDKAYRAAVADAEVRAQFALLEWEEELTHHDPGFRDPSPLSRLDAFHAAEADDLYFTEYNAETPAAQAYNDSLSEVFLALPIMRQFLRRYQVRPLPTRHGVLHALLDAHRQWSGNREPPRIAILDWREVPTYSEFVLFRDYFVSQGLPCVIADPREVEYRNGRLIVGDFIITLVYKRVLLSELVGRGGLQHPVVRGVREGAACMVNPFRCKILHKKASLAVLSDETNARLFTASETRAIEAHIPWTRLLRERHTQHRRRQIDLIPFVNRHREHLVLKPNDEYGGKGVVLGWQTDQQSWEDAVQAGLGERYVVQERVPLPEEPYPALVDGQVQIAGRMLDIDPFVFHGSYIDGCLTRLSTEALLNVTAGGGSTIPTFLVEQRD